MSFLLDTNVISELTRKHPNPKVVAWLQSGLRGGVSLVHSNRLLPFLGYWGMAFSYQ